MPASKNSELRNWWVLQGGSVVGNCKDSEQEGEQNRKVKVGWEGANFWRRFVRVVVCRSGPTFHGEFTTIFIEDWVAFGHVV